MACTLSSKVVCAIDHKHYIDWRYTGFIYGYLVCGLVIQPSTKEQ